MNANDKDTTKVNYHGDVDLEVVPRWHASRYLCVLLGHSKDVFHNNVGNENFCDLDIELKGDGDFDMYENACVIAYLQGSEVSIGLTPK